jgi:hypothetical protein
MAGDTSWTGGGPEFPYLLARYQGALEEPVRLAVETLANQRPECLSA